MSGRRLTHMQTRAIDFAEYSDPRDIEFTQRTQDAARNRATIGNQDFVEHE